MSKWDKRDEIRALKRKADETTDPFKIFESMIKLGYVKCSWDVLHKMCSSKLEMEYSRDGVQPEGELDVRQHSSNLEDYCERVEFVEEKIDEGSAILKNRFLATMDNYIYEALDEDNKENNDERIKDIVGSSNQDAKYKVLHTLAGYKGMLSAVWGVYSKMIENKTGKKPDERFLKAVEKDLNYGYSKLHDAIFKKDSFAAYA